MTEILITSAGRRVSLVQAFQHAADAAGAEVATADMNPEHSSACYISRKSVRLPHVLSDEYADALFDYCKVNSVRLVVPTLDTELAKLAELRDRLAAIDCAVVVSDRSLIDICRDKRRTADFFTRYGLNSPQLQTLPNLDYPVIVKPFDGSLSNGISILKSPDDLTKSIAQNPKNIYAQYLSHTEFSEYTCDVYFDRHSDLKCVVPRLRIETRGGEVSKGRTERNNIVPFLFDKLRRLEGARGCLTVQIMRHNNSQQLFLIEINPRFGGGYPLTAECGANYHSWLIDEYILGKQIRRHDDWTDGLTMLRYDAEVFVALG